MVLVHFNLRNPLLIGKKKTHDVQFFTEVVDASVALDGARRSMYDPDELDEEQRERQLRKKLNEMSYLDRFSRRHDHVVGSKSSARSWSALQRSIISTWSNPNCPRECHSQRG